MKREFLKKKSKVSTVSQPPAGPQKKYNYYVENFEEIKKPKEIQEKPIKQ